MTAFRTLTLLLVATLGLVAGCGRSEPAPGSGAVPATPTVPSGVTVPSVPAVPSVAVANTSAVGNTQTAVPPPADGPRYYHRVVALCIGIEQYSTARTVPAPDCEKSAQAMAELFANVYGFEVVKLLGKEATKVRVLAEIDRLQGELGDRDALIVYFAGHGHVIDLPSYDRAGYLLPYDANLDLIKDRNEDDWERKAINMASLTEGTLKAKAQHVLFLVNACCSGYMTHLGGGLVNRPDNVLRMTRRSRLVLAATDADSPATTGGGNRYGHFPATLRDQLTKGVAVSVSDLYSVTSEIVTRESKGVMFPQLGRFGLDSGEFVFIPKKFTEKDVETAIGGIEAELRLRRAQWTKPEHLHDLLETANYKTSPKRSQLEKVWEKRLARFQANTVMGDLLGLTALALCSLRGTGMERPDPVAAVVYAQRALDTKRPEGKFARAMTLLDGPDKNELAARELLTQASAEGFLLANVALADRILVGKPSVDEAARGDALLAKAEAAGILTAGVRRVAFLLRTATPTPDERSKLIERIRPAAEAGLAQAQYLTYQLLTGEAKTIAGKEQAEALKRLTQAAEAGHTNAQFQLAAENYQQQWFSFRLGIPKDSAAARLWATAAEQQGHVESKKILASIYLLGDGADRDINKALEYSRQVIPVTPGDNAWVSWFVKELSNIMIQKK